MSNFADAVSRYAEIGVDVEKSFRRLNEIAVSLHCWQGDDVNGFESDSGLDGGIAVTGNYPGRASTGDELRADLDFALKLIPGKSRLNLHAIYAEIGNKKVDRDQLEAEHFANFIDWAASRGVGLDFNPTFFSHPKAASGFTLSSGDRGIRDFWVEHGIACRRIAAEFGKKLNNTCITNFWIPDGFKDLPADRLEWRKNLIESLDRIFAVKIDEKYDRDAVESKLFGIGSESYVTGSHEFYMGYALSRGKMLCLDAGHFHPTETIADKISSILLFSKELLLHVSRGVRWDSDHVVLFDDALRDIAREIIRYGFEDRVHIGLDYFDASINRLAAWCIGARAMKKALLNALLEPFDTLHQMELAGNYTGRLALMENIKTLPFGEVWAEYCRRCDVPGDDKWMQSIVDYERTILSKR